MTYRSRFGRAPGGVDATSIVPATTLLLAAIGFGFTSRDVAAFLLGLVVLPALGLVTLVWIVAAALAPGRRWTMIGVASAVALLSWPALFVSNALHDRVRFAGWALTHQPLEQFTARDGVLAYWDSWGLAGGGNDSYLVADTSDSIGSVAAADRWRRRQRLTCEIVDSQRMWARFYIVTTYNCPFDFDGRHWS